LECYRGAGGVADDVGSGDAELVHQLIAVGGVRGHGGRALEPAAAGEACPVIAEQLVAAGQGGLVQERLGPCRGHAPVDEDDGFPRAGSAQLVFQFGAVDADPVRHAGHTSSSAWNRPKASWMGRSVSRSRTSSRSLAVSWCQVQAGMAATSLGSSVKGWPPQMSVPVPRAATTTELAVSRRGRVRALAGRPWSRQPRVARAGPPVSGLRYSRLVRVSRPGDRA